MHVKKFNFFSSFRPPDKHFRHQRGHHQTGSVKGSINISQNTTIAVNGVERQQTAKIKKTGTKDYMVFRSISSYFMITCGISYTERHPDIGRKFQLHC